VAETRINSFVQQIAARGGMAMSNGFAVKFDMGTDLKKYIDGIIPNAEIYEGFCDEAQLPPAQAATGQLQGRLLGEGSMSYAHTKLYTDVQLGWMCDANMEPYKFINAWWQYIFAEYNPGTVDPIDKLGYGPSTSDKGYGTMMTDMGKSKYRTTRVRYPDDYTATVRIAKVERGIAHEAERVSEVHVLHDAYPYTVESVPLSFGASQITKATATFHYTKHHVVYNDISNWSWLSGYDRGGHDPDDPEFGLFGLTTENGVSRGD
jgi:hypothetical protein|tara:strand:+ start:58 stop:846 length:789 start_codon:yes stop_codon:yes gene_type:complete